MFGKTKRDVLEIICYMLLLVIAFTLFPFACDACVESDSCGAEKRLPEYESEYFRYAVRKDGKKKTGYIIGFTALGAEQKALVLPQEIDGIPIDGIGYHLEKVKKGILSCGPMTIGELSSQKLQKLYLPTSYSYVGNGGTLPACFAVRWKDMPDYNLMYKGDIIGYPVYKKLMGVTRGETEGILSHFDLEDPYYLANVSYMYNYKDAPDDGYYWADSYDNTVIDFIPPAPTRNRFTFGGWYKEPSCVNAWDFETDTTDEALYIDQNTFPRRANDFTPAPQYDETSATRLYAKWVRK